TIISRFQDKIFYLSTKIIERSRGVLQYKGKIFLYQDYFLRKVNDGYVQMMPIGFYRNKISAIRVKSVYIGLPSDTIHYFSVIKHQTIFNKFRYGFIDFGYTGFCCLR